MRTRGPSRELTGSTSTSGDVAKCSSVLRQSGPLPQARVRPTCIECVIDIRLFSRVFWLQSSIRIGLLLVLSGLFFIFALLEA